MNQRTHKPSSWNASSQAKNSPFAPRHFAGQAQQRAQPPPTQEEIENEEFAETKFEAFGLQLQEKSETITPIGQERLGVLQAKMNHFWAQRLDKQDRPQAVSRMTQDARPAPMQRKVKAKLETDDVTSEFESLEGIAGMFEVEKKALITPLKAKLLANPLFPDVYKNDSGNPVQLEISKIFDRLIRDSTSPTIITAKAGEPDDIANQLFDIIGPQVTKDILNLFPHYKITAALPDEKPIDYLSFINTVSNRLRTYKAQINELKFDDESRATNAQMGNRVERLEAHGGGLAQGLRKAVADQEPVDALISQIKTFTNEVDILAKAWDLDFWAESQGLEGKIEKLAEDETLSTHYEVDGGEDDGMNVSDEWNSNLACTLYAILAIKPDWMGAATAKDLHHILRKTGQLKEYDDTRKAAKIRYLAGLEPIIVGAQKKKLGEFLQAKKQEGGEDSFIVDAEGIAHTFAAVWRNGNYVKVDEATPGGGNFNDYNGNKVLVIWK